jgi:NAD(P)H-hydrate epimerase
MAEIFLTLQDLKALLPLRRVAVHKGAVGKVLVVAGSRGMTGAAILASRAALRAGAGLVTLALPAPQVDVVDANNLEVMTFALPATPAGAAAKNSFARLEPLLLKIDTLLIGPGLGIGKNTQSFIYELLCFIRKEGAGLRTVIDADGLRPLRKFIRRFKQPVILTPHFGELAYLAECSIREIRERPVYYARKFADKLNAVIMLKSHVTYIIEPGSSRYFVNQNGNPGMATAGSGDVLSGLTAGLWGSAKLSAVKTAAVAPFIHGLAGGLAAKKRSLDGIIASDILAELPAAFKYVKGS